jgi:DNA-binding Lrp family transcriptional regulator
MINEIIKFPNNGDNKTMDIKEVAKILGVSWDTVRDRVKKLYPNKIRNGIRTLLNEEETIKIKESIKNNAVSIGILNKNNTSATLAEVETVNEKSIRIVETAKSLMEQMGELVNDLRNQNMEKDKTIKNQIVELAQEKEKNNELNTRLTKKDEFIGKVEDHNYKISEALSSFINLRNPIYEREHDGRTEKQRKQCWRSNDQ